MTDKGGECHRRHRLGEQKALSSFAVRLSQLRETGGRFHTFGHHVHIQPVRKLDHCAHDGLVTGVVCESGNKRLIDLERREWAAFQVQQTGIARAEVINRKANTDLSQGFQGGEDRRIAEDGRFGQLGADAEFGKNRTLGLFTFP